MGKIVANIVVKFGAGADSSAFYKIELDPDLNLDDSGEPKSRFSPGDKINFLVQHGPELTIKEVKSTDGMVSSSGQVVREREDSFLFAEETDSPQLSYLTTDSLDVRWYGNQASRLSRTGRNIIVQGGNYPCRAIVKYHVPFLGFQLHAPGVELEENETYPVDVVVYFDGVTP